MEEFMWNDEEWKERKLVNKWMDKIMWNGSGRKESQVLDWTNLGMNEKKEVVWNEWIVEWMNEMYGINEMRSELMKCGKNE